MSMAIVDKLFAFSSAWMCFINTQIQLQQALAEFQMEVWGIVEKETQAWITEFRSSLALLGKRAQAGQKKINASSGT